MKFPGVEIGELEKILYCNNITWFGAILLRWQKLKNLGTLMSGISVWHLVCTVQTLLKFKYFTHDITYLGPESWSFKAYNEHYQKKSEISKP